MIRYGCCFRLQHLNAASLRNKYGSTLFQYGIRLIQNCRKRCFSFLALNFGSRNEAKITVLLWECWITPNEDNSPHFLFLLKNVKSVINTQISNMHTSQSLIYSANLKCDWSESTLNQDFFPHELKSISGWKLQWVLPGDAMLPLTEGVKLQWWNGYISGIQY